MSQGGTPFDAMPGFALKRAQAAFHARMDAALRPLGLTVAQYACLEQLAHEPGISNAELGRRAFVSRQSMNVVLRGLEERGLLERDHAAVEGRAVPTTLTATGRALVTRARRKVAAVDQLAVEVLGRSTTSVVRSLHAVADRLEAGG